MTKRIGLSVNEYVSTGVYSLGFGLGDVLGFGVINTER